MRILSNTNYDFISSRRISYAISAFMVLASIAIILISGLQYGIDFKGGQEYVLEFGTPVDVTEARGILSEALNSQPEVKQFGLAEDILIRTDASGTPDEVQALVMQSLTSAYPNNPPTLVKSDTVGPRFAEDLKRGALYSIISSMAIIFLYVLVRFKNWTYSLAAVIGVAHDIIITLGMITLANSLFSFSMDIDQVMIAALLTIVGYSINDTVVVFDRIRENKVIHKATSYITIVNRSVNDTLSRTVITSGTTLFVVIVLFIFGGEVLKGFSLALFIGMVLGVYSTVWVASPIVVDLQKKFNISK